MKIRTLIVDDEPPARRRIRSLLEAEPDILVVGQCGDGRKAIEAIENVEPDLVFLDVQMPEADGFEVIAAVGAERMPATIFVTAYDEFAVRAFEVHALDYLLKPFDRERFRDALSRARARLLDRSDDALGPRLLRLLADLPRPAYLERVPVRAGGRIRFLAADEIDYVTAEGNYARLHAGERSYLIRETLTALEGKLEPGRFLRVHRSCIVRLERVKELESLFQGEYMMVLEDGTRLRSGRSFAARVKEAFHL
ncbi:MAG TPA: LytTR family DNA-binding domain-containing protein [Longimicrobiales bacterium]